ncbi:MAG: MSHA biogenesis protein MshA [Duganella sp.]
MSQQINLFNPIFLKQKKIFTALPMAEALAVIVAGALLLTWYAGRSVAELEQRAAAGKLLVADRERRLVAANQEFAPRPKSPTLAAEVAQAEAEVAALHRVEAFLEQGTLGNTAGYAEYFRALARQNVSGLWLTGVTIAGAGAGADIGVQGRAMQPTLIPQYIGRLKGERVMQGKTFATLDIARPDAAAAPVPAVPALAAAVGAPPEGAARASAAAPYVEFNLQSRVAEGAAK